MVVAQAVDAMHHAVMAEETTAEATEAAHRAMPLGTTPRQRAVRTTGSQRAKTPIWARKGATAWHLPALPGMAQAGSQTPCAPAWTACLLADAAAAATGEIVAVAAAVVEAGQAVAAVAVARAAAVAAAAAADAAGINPLVVKLDENGLQRFIDGR